MRKGTDCRYLEPLKRLISKIKGNFENCLVLFCNLVAVIVDNIWIVSDMHALESRKVYCASILLIPILSWQTLTILDLNQLNEMKETIHMHVRYLSQFEL